MGWKQSSAATLVVVILLLVSLTSAGVLEASHCRLLAQQLTHHQHSQQVLESRHIHSLHPCFQLDKLRQEPVPPDPVYLEARDYPPTNPVFRPLRSPLYRPRFRAPPE